MDDATRARLEQAARALQQMIPSAELARDLLVLLACHDALHAAQAQAAPVLVALERLVETTNRVIDTIGPQLELIHEPGVERLAATASQALALLDAEQVLAAWRAAREG